MRRLAVGVVLVAAALAIADVAASMFGTSLADSDRPDGPDTEQAEPNGNAV